MRDRKTASIFHRSQPAWATVSKHHLLGGLKNKYLFLRVMEAKSRIVRAGGQHGWFLGEGSPLPGYSLTQPSLGVCMQRQKTQVGSTFHRGVNSVMRVPPPWLYPSLITSERPQLLIPSPWWLVFQHMNCGET